MLLRLAAFLLLLAAPAQARSFTDAAGRTVELPDKVDRVLAAGPPASIAVYVLAPEKLLGWVRELRDAEREFIAEPYASLPVTGRLTGRGNTASLETVVALRPDVIVDVGSADPTYASLADRVQAQTGIPYVLIDGSFERTPAALRELGTVLGVAARGEELAGYAEQVLGDVRARLAGLPEELRPRVYYGRGPEGLDTGLKGSINVEILDLVGARNVAEGAGAGGLATISAEQVLAWDPTWSSPSTRLLCLRRQEPLVAPGQGRARGAGLLTVAFTRDLRSVARHGSEVRLAGVRSRSAGAVGLFAAGGETAAPATIHAGAGGGLGRAVPGRPARARAAQNRLDAGGGGR